MRITLAFAALFTAFLITFYKQDRQNIVDTTSSPAKTYKEISPISLNGASNLTISDGYINCRNVSGTIAINLSNCTNIHITKCKLVNVNSFAINLYKCNNITIDGCYFSYVGMGVYAQASTTIKVNK